MKVYGVAIVGTGMIARFHARAIKSLPNAKLVAVSGTCIEKAQTFCAEFGGRPYSPHKEMFEQSDVDVVMVATPSASHMEIVIDAAKYGKHCLCEKPLGLNTEQIDLMARSHKEAGTLLGCIFQFRYMPVLAPIREAIKNGRFGRITHASVQVPWWRDQNYYDDVPWHGMRGTGDGVLLNQSIHMLDLLCDLMPPVESVYSHFSSIGHDRLEVEDVASATLLFKGGAIGSFIGSTAAWPGRSKRLEISGTEGTVVLEDNNLTFFKFKKELPEDDDIRTRFAPTQTEATGAARPDAMTHELHTACLADFLKSVETNTPFAINAASARKSVALIEQMQANSPACCMPVSHSCEANTAAHPLRILVTAGPTREFLDPVRFLSNRSTGKMGFAIAQAALKRGHEVTIVAGPVSLSSPQGSKRIDVQSAREMLAAVEEQLPKHDVLIMSAAVADWRPANTSDGKLKKSEMEHCIPLEPNPDILKTIRPLKGNKLFVGFAAETGDPTNEAKRKFVEKGLDMIVANDVSKPEYGFASDYNRVKIITSEKTEDLLPMTKVSVGHEILKRVECLYSGRK